MLVSAETLNRQSWQARTPNRDMLRQLDALLREAASKGEFDLKITISDKDKAALFQFVQETITHEYLNRQGYEVLILVSQYGNTPGLANYCPTRAGDEFVSHVRIVWGDDVVEEFLNKKASIPPPPTSEKI